MKTNVRNFKRNSTGFKDSSTIGSIAYRDVDAFLRAKPQTISVESVEDDRKFQKKDIDLIWTYKIGNKIVKKRVEVKGDTYDKSGNVFLETTSNNTKKTPGCFMYTESDFIIYYFINSCDIYLIPTKIAQSWFSINKNRFAERYPETWGYGKLLYKSTGSVVKRSVLEKEVLGVRKKNIYNIVKHFDENVA